MKKYLLLLVLLTLAVFIKFYFINNPSRLVFALGFTDITKMATLIDWKPVPLPYISSYVEYPVIIGFFIWLMGSLTVTRVQYFFLTALVLSLLALLSFWVSQKMAVGEEARAGLARYWIFSPTVLLFTVYNWDILAVFFLLISVLLYLRGRDFLGTVFLTLGVWTKLFPIFLLPAIVLKRFMDNKSREAIKIALIFCALSLAINLPVAVQSFNGWSAFFVFSKNRGPNIDSVWAGLFVLSDKIFGRYFSIKNSYTNIINWVSNISLLLTLSVFYWKALRKRYTNLVVLTLSGILIFLVTAKVYSPPYNYWILPLVALTPISLRSFISLDISNVLVFWAVFEYFYEVNILGHSNLGFPWYKLTYLFVWIRQAMLLYLFFRTWRLIKGEE